MTLTLGSTKVVQLYTMVYCRQAAFEKYFAALSH